jgi:arginine exporter protein ArgO
MALFGWLLRIIGGLIIVFGWFAYLGTFGANTLKAMQDSIVYAIIATIVGLIIMILGAGIGRRKK